jgi:hypothetical protein
MAAELTPAVETLTAAIRGFAEAWGSSNTTITEKTEGDSTL